MINTMDSDDDLSGINPNEKIFKFSINEINKMLDMLNEANSENSDEGRAFPKFKLNQEVRLNVNNMKGIIHALIITMDNHYYEVRLSDTSLVRFKESELKSDE